MDRQPTFAVTAAQASDRFERDQRFRMLAMSIAAEVIKKHGRIDPNRADREAYDIAEKVAAMVVERMFHEDAELHAQREIADRFRKLAEESLALVPLPLLIIAPKSPNEVGT